MTFWRKIRKTIFVQLCQTPSPQIQGLDFSVVSSKLSRLWDTNTWWRGLVVAWFPLSCCTLWICSKFDLLLTMARQRTDLNIWDFGMPLELCLRKKASEDCTKVSLPTWLGLHLLGASTFYCKFNLDNYKKNRWNHETNVKLSKKSLNSRKKMWYCRKNTKRTLILW